LVTVTLPAGISPAVVPARYICECRTLAPDHRYSSRAVSSTTSQLPLLKPVCTHPIDYLLFVTILHSSPILSLLVYSKLLLQTFNSVASSVFTCEGLYVCRSIPYVCPTDCHPSPPAPPSKLFLQLLYSFWMLMLLLLPPNLMSSCYCQ